MTNLSAPMPHPSRSRRRPLGIWIVGICNLLYATLASTEPLAVLLHPGEVWSPASRVIAPIFILVAAAICAATVGVWFGSGRARAALLLLLSLFTATYVWNSIAIVLDWAQLHNDLSVITAQAWWNVTVGIRAVLWFGANWWYLFGSRTREFFPSRR